MSRDSPEKLKSQSRDSPEIVQRKSRDSLDSPETVQRQPRDSPETVQRQSSDVNHPLLISIFKGQNIIRTVVKAYTDKQHLKYRVSPYFGLTGWNWIFW